MKYRQLATTGAKISEVGFGCMSLSSNAEQENIAILQQAAGQGINYFDTADLYDNGSNELIVGKALKEMRNDVVIATKVGNQWRTDGSGWDWNPQPDYIMKAIEQSLKRLRTDRIDLYQLHGGTLDDPIDDIIETFEKLRTQGKILHYGISSIRPTVIAEYVKRSSMVSVMTQYSLADRRPEEETLPLLQKNNISIFVRGALAQGLLVDKPAKEYLGYDKSEIARLKEAVNKHSSTSRTPAQTAVQFVLGDPAVTSAIIGIRTREQLAEVTTTCEPLSEEELSNLKSTIATNHYEQHRINH